MSNDPRVTEQEATAPATRPGTEVTITKVHPNIWKEAMKLADGQRKRITVLSPTRVVVDSK